MGRRREPGLRQPLSTSPAAPPLTGGKKVYCLLNWATCLLNCSTEALLACW
jgi:hypothetical protein